MENRETNDQLSGMIIPQKTLDRANIVFIYSIVNDLKNLKGALARYGFTVEHIDKKLSIEYVASMSAEDVIIIDGTFLYTDTVSVIRRLLLVRDRPGILVRSSSNDEVDRIVALDMGADDCVDESCSAREISARTAAITRRASLKYKMKPESRRFEFAGWEFQADKRQLLTPGKNIIHLTGVEYSILSCLLSNPGSVKSRSDLRYYPDTIDDDDGGDPRTMDVLVSRLRKKMLNYGDDNIIETVRGFGYRLIMR